MHLVLSYFHQIKGPLIYISYPDALSSDVSNKLLRFFDLDIDETFFEIVLINQKRKIINLYFEVNSDWARGNKEMAMISLIMKKEYDSELVYGFLRDLSSRILNSPHIYKGFYKEDDFRDNDIEIDLYYEEIKTILLDCLDQLIINLETKDYL